MEDLLQQQQLMMMVVAVMRLFLVQIETDAKCWRMLAASKRQLQVCYSSI
jgi:hypothetical protein